MEFVTYIGTHYPTNRSVVRVFSDERFPWRRDETVEEMLTYVETNYKQELVDDIYSLLEEFENYVFEEEAPESSDAESLEGLVCRSYEEDLEEDG